MTDESKTNRFVVTVSPSDMGKAEAALKKAGVNVTDRMDAIGVLVVEGDEAAIKSAPGVKTVEPERIVRTQD